MTIVSFNDLDSQVQADVTLAKDTALHHAFPRDKATKAGCVLVAGGKIYTGSNIKRWSWNSTTCAERMALDQRSPPA